MPNASEKNAAFLRFCNQLPDEMLQNLNQEHLSAMEKAFSEHQWQNHLIDIRLSIPFPGRGFYFVLLGGRERRSKARLIQDRKVHPIWKPANFILVLIVILMGIGMLFATLQLSKADFRNFNDREVAPAIIPFKTNRSDCESSGRTWNDGRCIDHEHDREF